MERSAKQDMGKNWNLIGNRNLKDYFSDDLLEKLLKEEELKERETTHLKNGQLSDSTKLNSFLFNRTKFILNLLRYCKEKLKLSEEKQLARAVDWLTEEIQDSILFKSDYTTIKYLEELKNENKDLHTFISWLEEFSTIEFKTREVGEAKKKLKSSLSNPESLKISLSAVKDYLATEDVVDDSIEDSEREIKYINCSEATISSIDSDSFNIFKLESEVGEENILSTISCFIFATTGLYSKIRYDRFECFIQAVAKGYKRENPYHNDLHAADVLQTCYMYIKRGSIDKILRFDEVDQSALLISTIIHDFKHPGFTNLFLINTGDPIAIKYNDVSVLENYHIAESFKLLKSNPDFNILSELNKDEYKRMRKRMIECVLATDMSFHAKQFTYLKLKIENLGIRGGENVDKLLDNMDNMQIYSTQQEFLNILIHTADISNPTKPFDIYKSWAERVMDEFWRQGDREKELSLPVSFLCDRNTNTLAGAQIGFIEGIVHPFISSFVEYFPELCFLVQNASTNRDRFKEIKQSEEKKA